MMNAENVLLHTLPTNVSFKTFGYNDYSLHYVVAGQGEPVLLLHGINIGWGQWYANIPRLVEHFQVFALDLPGSGFSTKIAFQNLRPIEDFVDVVAHFIIEEDLEAVNIVGHSLGGWVALQLALRYPKLVSKLILVNSIGLFTYMPKQYWPIAWTTFANFLVTTVMKPTRRNLRNFLLNNVLSEKSIDDSFFDYFFEVVTSDSRAHPLLLMNRIAGFGKIRNEFVIPHEILKTVQQETLFIVGKYDTLTPLADVQSAARIMPDAQIKIFEESKHVPSLEERDTFNNEVIKFLQ